MAGFYQNFTTARTTEADQNTLLKNLRTQDATVGIQHPELSKYTLKKSTAWTPQQITFAQNQIDTCPSLTEQSFNQGIIDKYPISIQALVLTLIDEINILREQHGLPDRTPQQAFQAIRDKAGTL